MGGSCGSGVGGGEEGEGKEVEAKSMILNQVVIGILTLIISLLIILFRAPLAKSHLLTIPGAFGGKSFEEKFGKEKGQKYLVFFALLFVLLGILLLLTGILDVDIVRK